MAKYVLGDEGARKFKQLTNPTLDSGNAFRYGHSTALDNQYAYPYEVRWSTSLISSEQSPNGGYMIWLPNNCLYAISDYIQPSDWPQISNGDITKINNTSAWYELPANVLGNSHNNDFDLWLNDYLSAPSFATSANTSADVKPIHICRVKNYRPIADVKSAIIIGGDITKADERSIVLSSESYGENISAEWADKLHLAGFYFDNRTTNWSDSDDLIVRSWQAGIPFIAYRTYDSFISHISSQIPGGGGGSGEISEDQLSAIPSPGMFSWTQSTRTIGPGGAMFGRQWVTATGTGDNKPDGLYQLRCSIANTGVTTCAVVSDATLGQAPTTQYCWIPIYQITNGKIAADYRGAFVVPCYE